MIQIDQLFRQVTDQLLTLSRQDQAVDQFSVYQEANRKSRVLVEQIVSRLILPGSTIDGYENLQELFRRAQDGASCLILCEHYSNFDIPCLFLLAKDHPDGEPVTDSIVAMAGAKLNEESRFVLAFTEAYTRIVIYPARGLQALEGTPEYDQERARSRMINRSALREMIRLKHSGRMILLFPAGTRYRPGNPDSKRILLEVDSYIRGFDHLVFVGIAGNTLEVSPEKSMAADRPRTDVIVYSVSEVTDGRAFRSDARAGAPEGGETAKRAVADAVAARFARMHDRAESIREKALVSLAAQGVTPTRLHFETHL